MSTMRSLKADAPVSHIRYKQFVFGTSVVSNPMVDPEGHLRALERLSWGLELGARSCRS